MHAQFERLAAYLCAPSGAASKHPGTIGDELWIKVGHPAVLVRGVRWNIGQAIREAEDTVYLPLAPFCLYVGATLSCAGNTYTIAYTDRRYTLTVGQRTWSEKTALRHAPLYEAGNLYVDIAAIRRMFHLRQFYNPQIGLLIFSDRPMIYTTEYASLGVQIERLADLLFDTPTGLRLYEDMARHGLYGVHPRLHVRKDTYDRLRALWRNEEPETATQRQHREWLLSAMKIWEGYFQQYMRVDETGGAQWKDEAARLSMRQPYYLYDEQGVRLVGVKEYTYTNEDGERVTEACPGSGYGDGYDYGGRSQCRVAVMADNMANMYQITGEKRYLEAVWLFSEMADTWEHWGEGHFLDCASGIAAFASAIDLTWHAFDEEPEKRERMLDILYRKGLAIGAACIRGEVEKVHVSTINYNSWQSIHCRPNNWNSVCSSGLIAAALLLMECPAYREEAMFVAEKMLAGTKYCLHQYAPDGAYIESPSYWAYGTGSYLGEIAMLKSAVGETYGYLNTVGLKESFDFASCICNPEGYMWGFHDGGYYRMPGHFLYQAAELFGDAAPALFRERLLASGDKGGFSDLLYWKEYPGEEGTLPLDYRSIGIETTTFRDGWDRENYLFTGLHAGANWALHGDSDCGHFYLEMGGVTWFGDPGCENYNVGGYWGDELRYRYYNKSLEGHNVLLARRPDCPRGQVFNRPTQPHAHIVRYACADDGAFSVADMTTQYGAACQSAQRGLWLTNHRSIVVVQDEITMREPTDLIWVATPESYDGTHPHRERDANGNGGVLPPSDVRLSEDKKTAFIRRLDRHGKERVLRATLLSVGQNLQFSLIPADTTLFEETITGQNSGNKLAADAPARIAVMANGVTDLRLAVVFEMTDTDAPPAYAYMPMADWANGDD